MKVLLPGWAVDSGDHPGLTTGERASFALEFAPSTTLRRVDGDVRVFEDLGEGRYRVSGRVLVATPRLTVVDVGVLAFAARRVEHDSGLLAEGDWFTGEVSLGVDPFTYRELHAPAAGVDDITGSWTVESIEVQSGGVGPWSPVVDTDQGTPSVLYLVGVRRVPVDGPA